MPESPISTPTTPTPPGVLTPEEWAEAVRKQRIDRILPRHEGWAWGGIEVRPKDVRFASQNKGEKVFILLRRHFITNFGWLFSNTIYAAIPPLLGTLIEILAPTLVDVSTIPGNFIALFGIGVATYYSLILTNVIRHFVEWYFNVFFVTNERVLDFDFTPFVSRGVNETRLVNIENVKEKSIGFIPSLFNYGNVQIFSAADKSVITFDHIPRPTFVRDIIQDLADIIQESSND